MRMIEKVEAAIRDNIAAALPDGVEVDYRYAAVAAIQAMREASKPMQAAGSFLLEGFTEERAKRLGEEEHFESGCWRSQEILASMIDAALKESEATE